MAEVTTTPESTTTTPAPAAEPTAPPPEEQSSVSGEIQQMRERLARGEPILPQEPEPKPQEEPDAVRERGAEKIPVRPEAGGGEEVREGERREGGDPKTPEAPPAEEAVAAEAEIQPREGESDVPEGDEPEGPRETSFSLELPGRRPDDPVRRIEVEGLDPEEIEGLRRLHNGYLRRQVYESEMAAVEAKASELEETLTMLQLDPVGVLTGDLQPDDKIAVARHLLADPQIYQALAEEIYSWEDEQTRRAVTAELALDAKNRAEAAAQHVATIRAADQNARQLRAKVIMLASGMGDDEGSRFQHFAMRELQEFVTKNNIEQLDPGHVEQILRDAGLMQMFPVSSNSTSPSAAVRRATRPSDTSQEVDAAAAAKALRDRSARKRAATVAPAGSAAAPTSTQSPPEFKTVREGIEWFRKTRGIP